jgi:hypothetical protein
MIGISDDFNVLLDEAVQEPSNLGLWQEKAMEETLKPEEVFCTICNNKNLRFGLLEMYKL